MFDLSQIPPDFLKNPFPYYEALLKGNPVLEQIDGSIIISKHNLLTMVYKDTKTFSSDKKLTFGPKFGKDTPLFEHHTTSLVFSDPPLHTRVRSIMTSALNPRAIKRMEKGLEIAVSDLLNSLDDAFAQNNNVDLIESFAMKIPIQIIGNLLDIPMNEREPLRNWSLAILGALEPNLSEKELDSGNTAVEEFKSYLKDLVKRRKKNPGNPETDVLTRLIYSEDNNDLSETELLQNCIFILNAGHETTTNLIGNALFMLHSHPDQRELLTQNPGLINTAIEEVLRTQSPNQFGNRETTEPTEIAGINLDKNTNIHMCIGAANRDPDIFSCPNDFDITRSNAKKHLGFAAGPHVCVGLTLARLEAKIAVQRFLERFPHYKLTNEFQISPRIRFRGFISLPAEI